MDEAALVIETGKQFEVAMPLILANLMQVFPHVISLVCVSHLGDVASAAAFSATAFLMGTGFSLLMGLGSALETLCAQAFGARRFHMLGIHMQRAVLVLTIVSIPISILWGYTGEILMMLHQDKQISVVAGLYARWMIPALFACAIMQPYIRFLQTQNIVIPLAMSFTITNLLHIVLCWSLVFKLGMKTEGVALATSVSYWFNVLLLTLYVKLSPSCNTTWTGFSKEAFRDVFKFIKLAIPSAAMICFEFWAFESLILLSGFLPNQKLETSVISASLGTSAVAFLISMAFGAAISTRLGNELGAENSPAAPAAIHVALILAFTEGLIVVSIMLTGHSIWAHAFSNDDEFVINLSTMIPLIAFTHLVEAFQCVFSGTARGCGWQKIGALINFVSYYVVGIPFAMFLAFVLHLGIQGLWLGVVGGLFLQIFLYLIITSRTNWEDEVRKTRERLQNFNIPMLPANINDQLP